MFLAGLEREQKKAFLGLAHALIAADGVLENHELSTIEQYKVEMNLCTMEDEAEYGVEQAITLFGTASIAVKKQIVFELVALACVDKDFADAENVLIEKIQAGLDLNDEFLKNCKAYIEELTDLYERIGKLVS